MIGKRVLRKREVLERLGIRKTTLYENFVKTGRLRFVKIGARAVGVIEDELDALIEELRRERDRKPRAVCERPDFTSCDGRPHVRSSSSVAALNLFSIVSVLLAITPR